MPHRSLDALFKDYFADGTDAFLPHISINSVVLGYRHPQLRVLVYRFPDQEEWMLPGGYVRKEESLDEAAYRNLKLAGINNVFLRQIRTFGDVFRIEGVSAPGFMFDQKEGEILKWVKQRFVTVVYYGLVRLSETKVVPGGFMKDFKWLDVNHLERLAMDHASIIEETRMLLSTEILHYPVAENLLPGTFTLNELRGVFEAILHRSIDRGTFRRKMVNLGILQQVDQKKDVVGRPSHLFRFNQDKYRSFMAKETKFGF
ncbi:MAG: NUDIX hydrolase [Bacteroidales bacterium]